jgi:hypothetical protein
MESITYVNEIDVRKIAVGQAVRLSLDADPSKQLTGKVKSVANVGEQRPNADAKVFEVVVAVEGRDTTLLPGMTTSNGVEIAALPNAIFIPLEAMAVVDSVPIVYTRSGGRLVRQEIETGAMNENEIVVRRGLAAGDRVLLVAPSEAASLPLVRLEPGKTPDPDAIQGDTAQPAVRTARSPAN